MNKSDEQSEKKKAEAESILIERAFLGSGVFVPIKWMTREEAEKVYPLVNNLQENHNGKTHS